MFLEFVLILEQYFITYGLWDNFQDFIFRNGFHFFVKFLILADYIDIMEKLNHELEKTVEDFNNINQIKGFKAEYSLWNRTSNTVLCQMIVTRISDKVTRDKFILLDTKLDIRDEISYFIDDLVTSYYKLDQH